MLFKKHSPEDKILTSTIRGILGKSPSNLELYKLSLRHSSTSTDSNERLEYLGDAILGAIVAEYLFKKFPKKDEGFLTEIRSRIVKRESLNTLALKIGLTPLVQHNNRNIQTKSSSIYGNALEAFIGAIYLDKGYSFCSQFIIDYMITPHIDLKDIIENNYNFKSLIIEWAQKNGKELIFNIVSEEGSHHQKTFKSEISIDQVVIATGTGFSKKKAEQAAAQMSCEKLTLL
ncbi:ribonuclease III [Cyclobacteriaceae bacterium]|nr:ribonuclease III [Cyclobacteriaceae bacterium]